MTCGKENIVVVKFCWSSPMEHAFWDIHLWVDSYIDVWAIPKTDLQKWKQFWLDSVRIHISNASLTPALDGRVSILVFLRGIMKSAQYEFNTFSEWHRSTERYQHVISSNPTTYGWSRFYLLGNVKKWKERKGMRERERETRKRAWTEVFPCRENHVQTGSTSARDAKVQVRH